MSIQHKDATLMHVPYAFTYANTAAREGAVGLVPADVGKLARQTDNNSLWMLTDDSPVTWVRVDGQAGVSDHGGLSGLADDDHPQYTTQSEVDSSITTHAGAADPHTGYQRESEKSAASGYASLDAGTKVPTAELGGAGADATKFLRGDQSWAVPTVTITDERIFSVEGTLTTGAKPLRIYNKSGSTRTITRVFLAVNTAPTGAAIIVDVNKGGTTIFTTQANRPQIAIDAFTGESTTIDVTSWADGDYLQFDIDQIGSTIAGSDLTVLIVYTYT